jgi:hypothetical protein
MADSPKKSKSVNTESESEKSESEKSEKNLNNNSDSNTETNINEILKEAGDPETVNNFKGVTTNGGSELTNAFNNPLPKGTNPDAIEFNKDFVQSYDSKEYLPQEVNDEWFETDFTQAQSKLDARNLINTDKFSIGIDTVGQSLKNASWDMRGVIPNPKYSVSPWMNSTYEPDYSNKGIC